VGFRPATPDGRPVIGRVPGWSNVFVATGHGAEGLLLGPYSARLVAGTVLGLGADGPEEAALGDRVLHMCRSQRFTG
jgi:D-amino-acid dehydrogenase